MRVPTRITYPINDSPIDHNKYINTQVPQSQHCVLNSDEILRLVRLISLFCSFKGSGFFCHYI